MGVTCKLFVTFFGCYKGLSSPVPFPISDQPSSLLVVDSCYWKTMTGVVETGEGLRDLKQKVTDRGETEVYRHGPAQLSRLLTH